MLPWEENHYFLRQVKDFVWKKRVKLFNESCVRVFLKLLTRRQVQKVKTDDLLRTLFRTIFDSWANLILKITIKQISKSAVNDKYVKQELVEIMAAKAVLQWALKKYKLKKFNFKIISQNQLKIENFLVKLFCDAF